jgi:bacterioferritin
MPRHAKSIALLNKAVGDELSAVHQYMYFHFRCNDLGYDPLSMLFKRTAIEEMLHVEKLAERILFLKGEVNMEVADPVKLIHDPAEMLACAQGMEEQSAKDYNEMAATAGKNADAISKRLFEDLVADEERHCDQYEVQRDNLEKFGGQYLALQSIERGKSVAAGPPPAGA